VEAIEEENGKIRGKTKKAGGNKVEQVKRWREKNREKYLALSLTYP
jgi:hypothetical protein